MQHAVACSAYAFYLGGCGIPANEAQRVPPIACGVEVISAHANGDTTPAAHGPVMTMFLYHTVLRMLATNTPAIMASTEHIH